MQFFSAHHVDRPPRQLGLLAGVIALLYVAAGMGMAYVAGFDEVRTRLEHAHWWWLGPSFGGVAVAFVGYYFAYAGVKWAEDGPELDTPSLLAVVTAAFGGFLARGGTALDELAMRAGGADEREAKVRVAALGGFEQAVLAMIVCPASIAALATGAIVPRTDFTVPWAVIPPPAFVIFIWLAERYRDSLRGRGGWRERVGMLCDTAHIVYSILRHPLERGGAIVGMGLYWGAEMFAVWAAVAAFGVRMSALSAIVAFGTAMLFTRRVAPLAGAGLMTVALVPTLWYGAAVPFSAAVLGVVAYRFFTLWAPLPAELAAIPKLRQLVRAGEADQRLAPAGSTLQKTTSWRAA